MTDLVGKRVRVKRHGVPWDVRDLADKQGRVLRVLGETHDAYVVEFDDEDSAWFFEEELEVLDASNPPT